MNTNMKELNLNEMEQVNGGSVAAATVVGLGSAAAVFAVAAAAVKVASFVYDCATGSNRFPPGGGCRPSFFGEKSLSECRGKI